MLTKIACSLLLLPLIASAPFESAPSTHAQPCVGPEPIPVYVQRVVAGCTPILEKLPGGGVAWVGCPTWSCAAGDECQGVPGSSGIMAGCECIEGGVGAVLCQGIVVFGPGDLVDDWDCFKQACAGPCVKQAAPAAPGQFPACDC